MEMSTGTLQSYSFSIFPLSQQLQLQPCLAKIPTLRPRTPTPALLARYSRWDSNAEEVGPGKRFDFHPRDEDGSRGGTKKRRWWSDDLEDEEEEEIGIVEEVIDSIWILKVFRSYGWALPAVLVSVLLASGPKAFLMAMVFPLGQTAVTFAYNRLSGKKRTRSRVHTRSGRRRRKRPFSAASSSGAEEMGGTGQIRKSRNGNLGVQSWVDGESSPSEAGNGASSFGGWEELDRVRLRGESSGGIGTSSVKAEMGSRKTSREEAPLLLRLLVAMFPFLSLWTKMFW